VQVSIDGVDRADHQAIRDCTPEAYYRALGAVRVYREAGVMVDVATLLVGRNLRRTPEMVQLCQALGARKLRYCSFVPTGRAAAPDVQERYAAPAAEVDVFLEFLRSFRQSQKPAVDLVIDHGVGPWRADGGFACVSGREVAYITGEGDLYPCPSLMYEPFKVGNVYERGLRDLLDSKALSAVRELPRSELAEPCRSCPSPVCSGGCRGAVFAATGDLRAAPAYCNFRRRLAATED